jgi:large subunit ribosomal protein L14
MTKGLPIQGRITASRQNQVFTVLTERGSREIELPEPHKSAQIGDVIVLSVQIAEPRKSIKKKEVHRAVIVRQTRPFRRKDGSYVRFDENAVVILDGEKKEPKGGRIFGPIPRELAEKGYQKIISLAPEVV